MTQCSTKQWSKKEILALARQYDISIAEHTVPKLMENLFLLTVHHCTVKEAIDEMSAM